MYKKWRDTYKPYVNCLGSAELNMQEAFAGGYAASWDTIESNNNIIKELEKSNDMLRKELEYYQKQTAIKC